MSSNHIILGTVTALGVIAQPAFGVGSPADFWMSIERSPFVVFSAGPLHSGVSISLFGVAFDPFMPISFFLFFYIVAWARFNPPKKLVGSDRRLLLYQLFNAFVAAWALAYFGDNLFNYFDAVYGEWTLSNGRSN